MTLFLTASSLYSIFTQVPKTLNSSVALQVGLLKHLGDVATVLLDLDDQIRSRCGELAIVRLLVQTKISVITINGKMNVWKCKLIFPTDTLQQKIEITDLKPFLAAENTSVLIILATTVRHPQQHSIESVLGATGTADRMVVLHFGVLLRCCSVQVFLLKCAASEVAWHVAAVNPRGFRPITPWLVYSQSCSACGKHAECG